MKESRLEVRIEGSTGAISARAFLDVLQTTLDMLDQLERADQSAARLPGQWLIAELRNESATAALHRKDTPATQTPLRLVNGIGQLRESEGLPAYFSETIARGLVKIGKNVRQEGVSGISFNALDADEGKVHTEQINETVITNARSSIQSAEHAIGSVAGILDVINLRRGAHQVDLYDDVARRAVRCHFPDTLFETVRNALGCPVRALGEITRNRRGQILRVDIDQIELRFEPPTVPSVDDIAGIASWYTGSQSTDDYLRSVRGA